METLIVVVCAVFLFPMALLAVGIWVEITDWILYGGDND